MKHRRTYEPRIVGGKVVMMPADLQRLHQYLLETDVIELISDEKREVVEACQIAANSDPLFRVEERPLGSRVA